MNYSAQKEIVLKALKDNVVHPTAEYLCERIREVYPTLGVATVYRNLNKMAEGGVIKKLTVLSKKLILTTIHTNTITWCATSVSVFWCF